MKPPPKLPPLRIVVNAVRAARHADYRTFWKFACTCGCLRSDHIDLRVAGARARRSFLAGNVSGRDCLACDCPGFSPRWALVLFGARRRYASKAVPLGASVFV